MDMVAYYARYAAIYLLFGMTMGLSSVDKLIRDVPQWFTDQFQNTFVNTFPGITVAWRVAGVLEVSVLILLVVSLVTLEILPKRRKSWLKLGLGVAALTFTMLAIGQHITSQLDGAASLFFYFGATMATLLVVIFDESTYREQES